jgi:hypothetical protein
MCRTIGTVAGMSARLLARYWGWLLKQSFSFSTTRRLESYLLFCSSGEDSVTALTDTTLVIGCRHCRAGIDFRAMIAYKDGRFVCRDRCHTVRPGDSEYRCTCRSCLRLKDRRKS